MTPPPLPTLCWNCSRAIDPSDAYCRHCGCGQGEHVAWYYRPWGIALATVFGLGPLGLLLVWRSPRLSKQGKAAASLLILLFTFWVARGLYRSLQTAFSVLNGAGLPLNV